MGPDKDCPVCGVYRVRAAVSRCDVCEVSERYEARLAAAEARAGEAVKVADAAKAHAAELEVCVSQATDALSLSSDRLHQMLGVCVADRAARVEAEETVTAAMTEGLTALAASRAEAERLRGERDEAVKIALAMHDLAEFGGTVPSEDAPETHRRECLSCAAQRDEWATNGLYVEHHPDCPVLDARRKLAVLVKPEPAALAPATEGT